mgnify:FL=1
MNYNISYIEDVFVEDQQVTVIAMIEDMVTVHSGTYLDPPEYGPALCKATFEIDEDDNINLQNFKNMENYLIDIEWEIINYS